MGGGDIGLEPGIGEGIQAYALRQAALQQALANEFTRLWESPLTASNPANDSPLVDHIEEDDEDEEDEEDEEEENMPD